MIRASLIVSTGLSALVLIILQSIPAFADGITEIEKPSARDFMTYMQETATNLGRLFSNPYVIAGIIIFAFLWWRFSAGWQKKP